MLGDLLKLIYYDPVDWVVWSVVSYPVFWLLFHLAFRMMNRKDKSGWTRGMAALMAVICGSMCLAFSILPDIIRNGLDVPINPINPEMVMNLNGNDAEKLIFLANEQKGGGIDRIDSRDEECKLLAEAALDAVPGSRGQLDNRLGKKKMCAGAKEAQALQEACKTLHREYTKRKYSKSPLRGISASDAMRWVSILAGLCIIICWVRGYTAIKVVPCSVTPHSPIAQATLRKRVKK